MPDTLMDGYRATVLERSTLTFCLDGMSPRQEMLLKSFVRLLDHMTHQQWLYQPHAPGHKIDLWVVTSDAVPPASLGFGELAQQVLHIAAEGQAQPPVLSWPIRPKDLAQALNRLGGQAVLQRSTPQASALFTGAATGKLIARNAPQTPHRTMVLKKWPPQKLLAGPGRMRLATLLTGKPMSLDELVSRSALAAPLCRAFVEELKRAGLLLEPTDQVRPTQVGQPFGLMPRATAHKQVPTGLLDRIRLRLGIKTS